MTLTDFLKKRQVSDSESKLALKVYGDKDLSESVWEEKLSKSVKLNNPKDEEVVEKVTQEKVINRAKK